MMDPFRRLRAEGRLEEGVRLGPLTTYKFGGPARYLVTVDDQDDLRDAWRIAGLEGIPVITLGRGSNVVIADEGFDGIVLRAGPGLSQRHIDGDDVVAGGGAPLPLLAREAVRAGRGGLEFYTGIPGSVGGAVRMNAGCHGSETKDVLITALVFDASTDVATDRTPEDLGLMYRHSDLDDRDFVIQARFRTFAQEPEDGERELRAITRWRKEHQPGGTYNAGSVFRNPPNDAAGRIIDELGLKGFAIGGVSVSDRHANFFVAESDATATDVHALVTEVRRRVAEATGIELTPEIRFVGEFS
jgi:UDP-N-acetylmuramate dehydrogenase